MPEREKPLTSSHLIHFKWLDLCCCKSEWDHIIGRWKEDTLPIGPFKEGADPGLSGLTEGREV